MAEHLLPTVPHTTFLLPSCTLSVLCPWEQNCPDLALTILKLGGMPGSTFTRYLKFKQQSSGMLHRRIDIFFLLQHNLPVFLASPRSGEDTGMGAQPAPCTGTSRCNAASTSCLITHLMGIPPDFPNQFQQRSPHPPPQIPETIKLA